MDDARREDARLPRRSGELEPLELADYLQETVAAVELSARLHVLPP